MNFLNWKIYVNLNQAEEREVVFDWIERSIQAMNSNMTDIRLTKNPKDALLRASALLRLPLLCISTEYCRNKWARRNANGPLHFCLFPVFNILSRTIDCLEKRRLYPNPTHTSFNGIVVFFVQFQYPHIIISNSLSN